ncbi:unnamed protein product [Prunus armeniaca]
MTFGEQNTFPELFGLLDQALLSGINFFDYTEMYPVVPSGQMTWIRDGPKRLNAKNITEAIDSTCSLSVFGLQTDYIDHWPDRLGFCTCAIAVHECLQYSLFYKENYFEPAFGYVDIAGKYSVHPVSLAIGSTPLPPILYSFFMFLSTLGLWNLEY